MNAHFHLDRLITLALEEDLGHGDVTSLAVIPAEASATAVIRAKQQLTLAGLGVAQRVFDLLDPRVRLHPRAAEGDQLAVGEAAAEVEGPTRSLLTGERTVLNFLQRLSGVATLTRRFVQAVDGYPARIIDTRKTTPGWRILEKEAVRLGGGFNHRQGLYDGILIKDNHLTAAGGVTLAVERVRAFIPHTLKIQVEVKDLDELDEALAAGVDAVLLDNMDTETMARAAALARGKALTEASGGVTLERVREIAAAGVDLISVGALTHSAPAVDLNMKISS